MIRRISLFVLSAIFIVFTSCVSKKKFVEMESGRLKAEELSRQLSDENDAKAARIEALIADFESMKNELLENNAIKDKYIDSLNSEIFILAENLTKQGESLKETSFTLDFEKQRLTNALATKDKSISSLQTKVGQLETEVSNVNTVVDQKNFEIGKKDDKIQLMQGQIDEGDKKLTGLQSELNKVKAETEKLQAEMNKKDAEITKLQNNVKLLKKEMGG